MRFFVVNLLILLSSLHCVAQDAKDPQTITAGVEFRPIFPANFLKTGDQEINNGDFSVLVRPKFGFSAGMVIRYGFHKRLALETGINFVQRSYNLFVHRDSVANPLNATPAYDSKTDFTIIGYEHLIKLLVFIRLADNFYMNAAGGFQFTFFPSDIYTSDEGTNGTDQYFRHSSLRLGFDGKVGNDGFIHGGGIANLGWEYRTKKAGYFYLGATYQIPFAPIYSSRFQYVDENYESQVQVINLNGSYLTFDVRYFFNATPLTKREKKKKTNKKKGDKADD